MDTQYETESGLENSFSWSLESIFPNRKPFLCCGVAMANVEVKIALHLEKNRLRVGGVGAHFTASRCTDSDEGKKKKKKEVYVSIYHIQYTAHHTYAHRVWVCGTDINM